MMLNFPTKIFVLGIPFQVKLVEVVDPTDPTCVGMTNGELRIIKIQKDQGTRRLWSTLMHEYHHAVNHVTGIRSVIDHDLEEIIVQSYEHAQEAFFKVHGEAYLAALKK